MSLRSEVKWRCVVYLNKPIEHCLEIALFELGAVVPSIHEYLSLDTRPDRGYESFEVVLGDNHLQSWRYEKNDCRLIVPLAEVQGIIAQATECKLLIKFKETNALIRLGDSYLYGVEYDIPKLFPTSTQIKVSCPGLRAGWQEKLYKVLAKLFRIKCPQKIIPVGKDPAELSENKLECDFHLQASESPSFKMLFSPIRFDLLSVILGIIGTLIVGFLASLLAEIWV